MIEIHPFLASVKALSLGSQRNLFQMHQLGEKTYIYHFCIQLMENLFSARLPGLKRIAFKGKTCLSCIILN